MRQELNRINRPIYGHDFKRKPAHRARHAVVRALSLKNGAGLMTNSFIIGLIESYVEDLTYLNRFLGK